jgi:hypothetical protein
MRAWSARESVEQLKKDLREGKRFGDHDLTLDLFIDSFIRACVEGKTGVGSKTSSGS